MTSDILFSFLAATRRPILFANSITPVIGPTMMDVHCGQEQHQNGHHAQKRGLPTGTTRRDDEGSTHPPTLKHQVSLMSSEPDLEMERHMTLPQNYRSHMQDDLVVVPTSSPCSLFDHDTIEKRLFNFMVSIQPAGIPPFLLVEDGEKRGSSEVSTTSRFARSHYARTTDKRRGTRGQTERGEAAVTKIPPPPIGSPSRSRHVHDLNHDPYRYCYRGNEVQQAQHTHTSRPSDSAPPINDDCASLQAMKLSTRAASLLDTAFVRQSELKPPTCTSTPPDKNFSDLYKIDIITSSQEYYGHNHDQKCSFLPAINDEHDDHEPFLS